MYTTFRRGPLRLDWNRCVQLLYDTVCMTRVKSLNATSVGAVVVSTLMGGNEVIAADAQKRVAMQYRHPGQSLNDSGSAWHVPSRGWARWHHDVPGSPRRDFGL